MELSIHTKSLGSDAAVLMNLVNTFEEYGSVQDTVAEIEKIAHLRRAMGDPVPDNTPVARDIRQSCYLSYYEDSVYLNITVGVMNHIVNKLRKAFKGVETDAPTRALNSLKAMWTDTNQRNEMGAFTQAISSAVMLTRADTKYQIILAPYMPDGCDNYPELWRYTLRVVAIPAETGEEIIVTGGTVTPIIVSNHDGLVRGETLTVTFDDQRSGKYRMARATYRTIKRNIRNGNPIRKFFDGFHGTTMSGTVEELSYSQTTDMKVPLEPNPEFE